MSVDPPIYFCASTLDKAVHTLRLTEKRLFVMATVEYTETQRVRGDSGT